MEILWEKKTNQKLQKNSLIMQANLSSASPNVFFPYLSSIKRLHFPINAHTGETLQGYKLTGTAFPALSNSVFPSSCTRIPMLTR